MNVRRRRWIGADRIGEIHLSSAFGASRGIVRPISARMQPPAAVLAGDASFAAPAARKTSTTPRHEPSFSPPPVPQTGGGVHLPEARGGLRHFPGRGGPPAAARPRLLHRQPFFEPTTDAGVAIGRSAGEPGLEPELGGPKPPVLPITPLPTALQRTPRTLAHAAAARSTHTTAETSEIVAVCGRFRPRRATAAARLAPSGRDAEDHPPRQIDPPPAARRRTRVQRRRPLPPRDHPERFVEVVDGFLAREWKVAPRRRAALGA
jgi:hypothetical protein